jgi:hypothetical protein
VVECFLAKEDVAGSTPVSRSNHLFFAIHEVPADRIPLRPERTAWADWYSKGRGTQVVRERSAKPLCVGSIPTRASKKPK